MAAEGAIWLFVLGQLADRANIEAELKHMLGVDARIGILVWLTVAEQKALSPAMSLAPITATC